MDEWVDDSFKWRKLEVFLEFLGNLGGRDGSGSVGLFLGFCWFWWVVGLFV